MLFRFAPLVLFAALPACGPTPSEPMPLVEGTWSVDTDKSSLSYVSIKSGEVAESNSLSGFSGSVSAQGATAWAKQPREDKLGEEKRANVDTPHIPGEVDQETKCVRQHGMCSILV